MTLAVTGLYAALHTIGGLLLASRVLHPFGLAEQKADHPVRIVSGVMTTLSLVIAIGYIFWWQFAA